MENPLKILIVEDNPVDAELIRRVLMQELTNLHFKICTSRSEFSLQLESFFPDVILCDNSLPGFDSAEALSLVKTITPYTPFILVTGTVSEEYAAEIIRSGADDYILKDRMARLPAAVESAVAKRKAEKEKETYVRLLAQSQENLQTIFNNTSEGFLLLDRNLHVKAFNHRVKEGLFQHATRQMTVGQKIEDLIDADRHVFFEDITARVREGEVVEYSRAYDNARGTASWIQFSFNPVFANGEFDGICITGRDITSMKEAEALMKDEQKRIARAILKAQERERNSIGTELHDNVNQIIVGANLMLSHAKMNIGKNLDMINLAMESLQLAIVENRKIAHEFVPPDLDNTNLVEQLGLLFQRMLNAAGIAFDFVAEGFDEILLDGERKLHIYRMAQEQCTNIVKYSQAKKAVITLSTGNGQFQMLISDNGKGSDLNKSNDGIGLRNIRNRLSLFNGTSKITTATDSGFSLMISLPLEG